MSAIVRAIINLVMLEYSINQKNGFVKTFILDLNDIIKRNSIPHDLKGIIFYFENKIISIC